MKLSQNTKDIIWSIILGILLVLILVEFCKAFTWMTLHLKLYLWFFIGIAAYFLLRLIPAVKKNEDWLQTFTHELTHTIAGLLCFQKIHSFEAKEKSGVIYHSGKSRFGSTFISLAPYCFPIYTFLMLLFRIIGAWKLLYVFDILIGLTLAFHGLCIFEQARPYQTDIKNVGYTKAYMFIAALLLFNLTIILLSIRKGIVNANIFLFTSYWQDIVAFFKFVF